MKYFIVQAKCGHVGRNRYIPIDFPVVATSASEAAQIVRMFPRVKHNHSDAILWAREVSEEKYQKQSDINNKDPYLHIKSKYQQKCIEGLIESRLVSDEHNKVCTIKSDKTHKAKKYRICVQAAIKQITEYYLEDESNYA